MSINQERTKPISTAVESSCHPNPCMNNGTCQEDSGTSFACTCSDDFTGSTCDKGLYNKRKNFT